MTETTDTALQTEAETRPHQMVTMDDYQPVSPFANMTSFEKAQRVAFALASSTLVPEAYQQFVLAKNGEWVKNPAAIGNCLIALEMASRMPGLSPLMVMQNMDVVKGRPGWRGAFAAGRVNASSLFSRLKYEYKGEPGTKEYGCRAYATEKETGDVLYGTWITWAMVTGEGWDSNKKWNTMRDQMFQYRSATFWCRAYAPDLLLGLQTAEELEDVEPRLIGDHRSVGALNERLRIAPETELAADATNQQEPAEDKPGTATTPRKRKAREPLAQAAAEPEKAPDGIDAGAVGEPATDQAEPAADPAPAAAADTSFDVE